MPELPIIQSTSKPPATPADLVRLFHRTEVHWIEHFSERVDLDVGSAFVNQKMSRVPEANQVMDVVLPNGVRPAEAFAIVQDAYVKLQLRCHAWSMNLSDASAKPQAMVEHLLGLGYRPTVAEVMRMERMPSELPKQASGLTIIPTRASIRHFLELTDPPGGASDPQFTEARLAHLDDARWDSLLALRDGKAVATAGVLSVGETGRIDQVYVAPEFRKQGIGAAMMIRVLEICARSLFKHVFLSVEPGNAAAMDLYHRLGFQKVGQLMTYRAP